ncbi:MAG: TIGR03619 family F420-dependent LLM class oxidoreductase [Pseudomonadales bacterium]|nr:TIGR03619 family F420-dependent LLM class oxidoreductase [Pseudomonadales bacterium]
MTDFGLLIFATDYSVAPGTLAQEAEKFGFESLFFPEHTHIPASRKSPWPGGRELPQEYWHTHDPFVSLMAAAAVTNEIKVGTGITLITERDPILMAKQAATLDFLSNGRFLMGVGAGWNAEEMENHGTPFADRWKILRERILAMKEIWTEEEAEYHGKYVDFDKVWSHPKPKQAGGPPILMGASSKYTYKRIAEYCDGWFPIYQDQDRAAASGAVDYAEGMRLTREAWQEAGREGEPSFSVFGVGPDPQAVERMVELGFDRVIFGLPSADADTVLPMVENYAALAHKFNA